MSLFLPIILALAAGGCYDARNVSDQLYIMNMAFDVGEKAKLRMAVELPSPQFGSTGGGESQGSSGGSQQDQQDKSILVAEGNDLAYMMELLRSVMTREVNYRQVQQVFVAEELARSDEFAPLLSDLVSLAEMRQGAYLLICRDKAEDVLRAQSPELAMLRERSDEYTLALYIRSGNVSDSLITLVSSRLGSSYSNATAIYAATNEGKALEEPLQNEITSDTVQPGDLPRKGVNTFEYHGCALFDRTKMVGTLTAEQTKALLLLGGQFVNGLFAVQDGQELYYLSLFQNEPPVITVDWNENGELTVHACLKTRGSLYVGDYPQKELRDISQIAEEYLEQLCRDTVSACQALGVEPFGFAGEAARHFAKIETWEQYDWPQRFAAARFDVEAECLLQPFGDALNYAG